MIAVVGCGTIAIDVRTQIISQQEIRQNLEYTISGPLATLLITDGEIDLGEENDLADLEAMESIGWDIQMDVVQVEGEDAVRMRMSQTFKGEDAAEQFRLASTALAEQDTSSTMIPLLEITENEDEIIYELRMSVEVDDEAAQPGFTTEPEPIDIDGTPFPGFDTSDPEFGEFGAELENAFSDGLQDFTDALEASFEDFITVTWTVEMPGDVSETNATNEDGNTLTWDLGFSELSDGGELFARSVVSKHSGGSCNL